MRHIFVIFSGITRLGALATIDHLGLKPSKTVVILGRDEAPIDGLECHPMQPIPMRLGRNPVRFRYQLRQFDRWIQELSVGEPLAVYLPGLFSEHLYALATAPRVVQVNFLEEGLGSLMRQTRVYGRRAGGHSYMAQLAAGRRFPAHLSDCSHLLDTAFHFSPEAFPDWGDESRVLLQWPDVETPSEAGNLGAVVSVETLVEEGHLDLESYVDHLRSITSILHTRFDGKIGIKFHPGVMQSHQQKITHEIATNKSWIQLIPGHVTLETLMSPGGPVIVGASTSSLHYAVLTGGSAMTYVGIIESRSLRRRFETFYNSIPDTTRSKISNLT